MQNKNQHIEITTLMQQERNMLIFEHNTLTFYMSFFFLSSSFVSDKKNVLVQLLVFCTCLFPLFLGGGGVGKHVFGVRANHFSFMRVLGPQVKRNNGTRLFEKFSAYKPVHCFAKFLL